MYERTVRYTNVTQNIIDWSSGIAIAINIAIAIAMVNGLRYHICDTTTHLVAIHTRAATLRTAPSARHQDLPPACRRLLILGTENRQHHQTLRTCLRVAPS